MRWWLSVLLMGGLVGGASRRLPESGAEASAPVPAPAIWGALAPGRFEVGVRVLALPAEVAAGGESGASGPLQVTLWYPVTRGQAGGSRLHYRDYVALSGTEQQASGAGDTRAGEKAVADYRQFLSENGVPAEAVEAWLGAEVAAVRDAPAAPGRFPLVLIAQGPLQSAHHQAVLAEYLASHGYAVATTPSPARRAPPGPDEHLLASARLQAGEMERALGALGSEAMVDGSRVALVGHSFGARSAFVLALRRPVARS